VKSHGYSYDIGAHLKAACFRARMQSLPDISVRTREPLRRLAQAVVVITTQCRGQRFAMSATAVSEVSLSPSFDACLHQPVRLDLLASSSWGEFRY
jgi:hypothetical protein